MKYHVNIWQVSPQLSCGDTCQIWMWFREFNRYFCKIENFAYGEISERSFSNPTPGHVKKLTKAKGLPGVNTLPSLFVTDANFHHATDQINTPTMRTKHPQSAASASPIPLKVSWCHYTDVMMTTMASQITSLTVVYSIVYLDANQRKHQSSASLAFVWGIHRSPEWNPRTNGQLRVKCFHLMTSSWYRDVLSDSVCHFE